MSNSLENLKEIISNKALDKEDAVYLQRFLFCRACLHLHELVHCRWVEDVTQVQDIEFILFHQYIIIAACWSFYDCWFPGRHCVSFLLFLKTSKRITFSLLLFWLFSCIVVQCCFYSACHWFKLSHKNSYRTIFILANYLNRYIMQQV